MTGARGLGACLCACLAGLTGCRSQATQGSAALPPIPLAAADQYADIAPRWSPDGRRIAFLRIRADRTCQPWVASRDLRHLRPLAPSSIVSPDRPQRTARGAPAPAAGLAWLPDGSGVAVPRAEWFALRDGERLPGISLWLAPLDNSPARPLAVHPELYEDDLYYYRSPAFSRDGRRLAFVGEGRGGAAGLYVRTLARHGPAMDRPRPDEYVDADLPTWSPHGGLLALRQGIQRAPTSDPVETVRVIEPGGWVARRVAVFTATVLRGAATPSGSRRAVVPRVTGIAWSADGKRLACTVEEREGGPAGVWVVGTDGGGRAPTRATPAGSARYAAPMWLAPGVVLATRVRGAAVRAVLIDAATHTVRPLVMLPGEDPGWSPDGRAVVCSTGPRSGQGPAAPAALRVLATGYEGREGAQTPSGRTRLRPEPRLEPGPAVLGLDGRGRAGS